MTNVKKTGEKGSFGFPCDNPLAMECFAPGRYEHRGACGSGSRNTGHFTLGCLTNLYRGCPFTKTESAEAVTERKADGWKVVR